MIEITGVPVGDTLRAGTDNGGGSWTLTPAELAGLTITPPADSDSEFQLNVIATATETSPTSSDPTVALASASASSTIDVRVDAVAEPLRISARLVPDPVFGWDLEDNYQSAGVALGIDVVQECGDAGGRRR